MATAQTDGNRPDLRVHCTVESSGWVAESVQALAARCTTIHARLQMRIQPDSSSAGLSAGPFLIASFLLPFLVACGDGDRNNSALTEPTPAVPGSAQQVEEQVGDVSFIAVAIQTSQIPQTVATEHGVERRDDVVMLRVSPRQGEAGSIQSAPAAVRAVVTDEDGDTSVLELEKTETAGLVDHVATMEVTLPAILHFEITATTSQGASEKMELIREFSEL